MRWSVECPILGNVHAPIIMHDITRLIFIYHCEAQKLVDCEQVNKKYIMIKYYSVFFLALLDVYSPLLPLHFSTNIKKEGGEKDNIFSSALQN